MAIDDWTFLKCECGGDLFVALTKLKHKSGGGTVHEPGGHWCVACHAVVDNRYMARLVEIDAKRRQIKELQAEVAAAEAPVIRPPEPAKVPAGR